MGPDRFFHVFEDDGPKRGQISELWKVRICQQGVRRLVTDIFAQTVNAFQRGVVIISEFPWDFFSPRITIQDSRQEFPRGTVGGGGGTAAPLCLCPLTPFYTITVYAGPLI